MKTKSNEKPFVSYMDAVMLVAATAKREDKIVYTLIDMGRECDLLRAYAVQLAQNIAQDASAYAAKIARGESTYGSSPADSSSGRDLVKASAALDALERPFMSLFRACFGDEVLETLRAQITERIELGVKEEAAARKAAR